MKTRKINGRERRIDGWRESPRDDRDRLIKAAPPGTIAPRWDLRATPLPAVEDQGHLGSCTAQGGTNLVEQCHLQAGQPAPDLSQLALYYMTRADVAGWDPADDSGAYIRDTLKALNQYGACLESLWPYDVSKFSVKPSEAAYRDAMDRRVTEYRRCDSLDAIRTAISTGHAVEGGFTCPESMFGYATQTTGIVPEWTEGETAAGGHAVLFVGYDDDTRLLCFMNSWGTDWGDNGFGYLPYSYWEQGRARDFWTVTGASVGPVPPAPPAPKKKPWWRRLLEWLVYGGK